MGIEQSPPPPKKHQVFEYLGRVLADPGYRTYFEIELERAGLILGLEEKGILPIIRNPNPFDPETEEKQNERWADEHPTETAEFIRKFERREEVIRYLFVGAVLGRLFGDLFPQKNPPPRSPGEA